VSYLQWLRNKSVDYTTLKLWITIADIMISTNTVDIQSQNLESKLVVSCLVYKATLPLLRIITKYMHLTVLSANTSDFFINSDISLTFY